MNTTISKIINFIGKDNCKYKGSIKKVVNGVNQINTSKKGEMTFCTTFDEKAIRLISSSNATVIICHEKLYKKLTSSSTLIFVDNPRRHFLRCVKKFYVLKKSSGIEKTAVIKSKTIHSSTKIGSFVYVGTNVSIGKNCIIEPGVVIYDNTRIGNNVRIHASAVIGADGYGFEKDESENWEKFPQIGGVEIEDDVEIGANSCIMKGALSDTKIGTGSKIGHLVNIGHNVKIGTNCMILPQTVIAGGVRLGNDVFVSIGVKIRDTLIIKDNVIIGMGSVVTKNVPSNVTIIGFPAKPIRKKTKK